MRICSIYGAGFFTIPGTDTCLRIGGRARGEIRYLEPGSRADDSIGYRTRGRIALDARTRTSYGLLRAKTQYEFTHNTGNYGLDTFRLDEAFIEFGGLTAGRLEFFSEWRIGTNLGWLPVSGLYLGIETFYRSVDPQGRVFVGNDPASDRLINSADALEARLRVQRDF